MTLSTLFDRSKFFDPFTVGYSRIFDDIEKFAKTATNYPPYNIKQVDENHYVIEVAVAGFSKQDIDIELNKDKLVIRGNVTEDKDAPSNFLYKGIAERAFTRTFNIADTIEIKDAELANGMLRVFLENMVKLNDAVKKIPLTYKGDTESK